MARRLILAGVLLGAGAAALEPHLVLRLRDARTGEPVADVSCGLVGAKRRVYARFAGTCYTGARPPRAGDELYVYRRGYDVLRVVLKEEREIAAALAPAAGRLTLLLDGAAPADLEPTVQARIRPDGWRHPAPFEDDQVHVLRGRRLDLVVPRGAWASLLVETDRGVLWPVLPRGRAGDEFLLRYDAPREVRVRHDAGLALPRASAVECMPDRLWTPAAPPLQIDAWRWHLGGPGWIKRALRGTEPVLPVSPPVPFHFFARIEGRPVYRYCGLADGELRLRRPFALKRVAGRPLVDGREVPAGTFLAPGRLDACVVTRLAYGNPGLGACHRVGPGRWPPVALPPARVLTAWHPETGLAHLAWEEDAIPSGRSFRGSLVVAAPPGWRAEGYVSAFPVWKGANTVRATPPDNLLRKRFDASGNVRFPGLVPGRHGLDLQVVLTHTRSGRERAIRRMAEVDVPAGRPGVVFRLPVR